MEIQRDTDRRLCATSNGRPYLEQHYIALTGYLVIEPRGRLLEFCDTDCLLEFYRWQGAST